MTGQELLAALVDLSESVDLGTLQIVIRLEDSDEDTHMGGLASLSVDSGCTDTPMLVFDCDQDPKNCPLGDDE